MSIIDDHDPDKEVEALEKTLGLSEIGTEGRAIADVEQEDLPHDRAFGTRSAVAVSSSVFEALSAGDIETDATEAVPALSPLQDLTNTTIRPWRIVAHLEISIGGEILDGTAFFITNSVLLTAGHNVFSHDFGRKPTITVFPGRNQARGYGRFTPTAIEPSSGWLARDPNADFGIIAISQPPALGTFGIRDLKPGDPNEVFMSGYPANRTTGTQSAGLGSIASVVASRVGYTIATEGGQSGAPVAFRNTQTAIAVHVARPGGLAQAIRVTPAVKAEIVSMIRAL